MASFLLSLFILHQNELPVGCVVRDRQNCAWAKGRHVQDVHRQGMLFHFRRPTLRDAGLRRENGGIRFLFLETDYRSHQCGLFPLLGGHRLAREVSRAPGESCLSPRPLERPSLHQPALRVCGTSRGTAVHSRNHEHLF